MQLLRIKSARNEHQEKRKCKNMHSIRIHYKIIFYQNLIVVEINDKLVPTNFQNRFPFKGEIGLVHRFLADFHD